MWLRDIIVVGLTILAGEQVRFTFRRMTIQKLISGLLNCPFNWWTHLIYLLRRDFRHECPLWLVYSQSVASTVNNTVNIPVNNFGLQKN